MSSRPEALLVGHAVDDVAGEHDHAGARARAWRGRRGSPPAAARAGPTRSISIVMVVLSPPGSTMPSSPRGRQRCEPAACARRHLERANVLRESTLHREDPDESGACALQPVPERSYQPRAASSSSFGMAGISRPSHRPSPARRTPRPGRPACRSRSWPRRSPWRASAGPRDLKMPEPTKTPSTPSCIISAASAGVAMPPAAKLTTGSRPRRWHSTSTLDRGADAAWPRGPARRGSCPCSLRMPALTARAWRTASTMLPVPASPLVRIIAAPSAMRRSRLAQVAAAADERHLERVLVDVVLLVGGGQHLGLVDVVDAERLRGSGPRRSGRSGTWPSPGS